MGRARRFEFIFIFKNIKQIQWKSVCQVFHLLESAGSHDVRADANTKRDSRIFEEFAYRVMAEAQKCRGILRGQGQEEQRLQAEEVEAQAAGRCALRCHRIHGRTADNEQISGEDKANHPPGHECNWTKNPFFRKTAGIIMQNHEFHDIKNTR